jgi:hypothetical protein
VDSLNCLNCKKPVASDRAKIFAEVFVCPACYETAERMYKRSEGELRMMLTFLRESIRLALIEGRLFVNEGHLNEQEVPKTELLRMIVRLEEQREASRAKQAPPTLPSGKASPNK